MGELMKLIRLILAALAFAVLADYAHAQGAGGGSKPPDTRKNEPHAPKADEKAYRDALKSVPNKPYDPWQGAR
jgi:hypothetical protein